MNIKINKMKDTIEFLKKVIVFQNFAEKRGYELLMAKGCEIRKLYKFFNSFEFEEKGVTMIFQEDTRRDCPDYESIELTIKELEMTDEEWTIYIEQTIKNTEERIRKKHQEEEKRKLERKQELFKILKEELGYSDEIKQ